MKLSALLGAVCLIIFPVFLALKTTKLHGARPCALRWFELLSVENQ